MKAIIRIASALVVVELLLLVLSIVCAQAHTNAPCHTTVNCKPAPTPKPSHP